MKSSMIVWGVWVVLAGFLSVGCRQIQQNSPGESVAVEPSITADCIVQYFKANASAYITHQEHRFNPSEKFFQAVSTEPIGIVQCSLHGDVFTSSGLKSKPLSDLPSSFWTRNLAAAVFYGFCGAGGLIETEAMASGDTIKIEGRWFRPLTPEWSGGPKLKLLYALDSKQVELVFLEDAQNGLTWLVRGYNLRFDKELSTRLPRTIDVYDIRDGIASKELMIRFDYQDIQKAQTKSDPIQ
ncbi:MAG: hypothetical protein ACYSOP_02355 [Planctomycetota bacterium]|jgi:hypothetical protein